MTAAGTGDRPRFLVELAQRRDVLLARIREAFEADERVLAAWLAGSYGRGTADEWSDIDLHVVVRDDDLTAWQGERNDLYHRVGHPLMRLPSSASEKGDYQGVLFAGPVFLDLAVHPVSTATRDADTRLLLTRADIPLRVVAPLDDEERRTRLQHDLDFFWAMAPIALKYVGRGRTERAVAMVDLLAGTFVRLWRLVHDPARRDAGGVHWLHPERDAGLIAVMPRFGDVIDPSRALLAVTRLMIEVRHLHPAIERLDVAIPTGAVAEIDRFRERVAGMVSGSRRGAGSG
ncbi:MAG: nucleotidyltransferase domain-containing protein [Chloroflexota bacterium]|nr:nucleotidyltransferase domain-containing protein [Chloroflexota bacterium]